MIQEQTGSSGNRHSDGEWQRACGRAAAELAAVTAIEEPHAPEVWQDAVADAGGCPALVAAARIRRLTDLLEATFKEGMARDDGKPHPFDRLSKDVSLAQAALHGGERVLFEAYKGTVAIW